MSCLTSFSWSSPACLSWECPENSLRLCGHLQTVQGTSLPSERTVRKIIWFFHTLSTHRQESP